MNTLLDNDLYKFTMMQAVWLKYPKARVRYQFINRRREDVFTEEAVHIIRERIMRLADCCLTEGELQFLAELPFIRFDFIEFLRGFTLSAEDVKVEFEDGHLHLWIEGTWVNTILWEVPLMAIISEVYFEVVDMNWTSDLSGYAKKTAEKGRRLSAEGCNFFDFGTRRRRSYAYQDAVVAAFNDVGGTFGGTSNLHFAMKYGLRPIGTMAHEWIMGHAGLGRVETANQVALDAWLEVYQGQLDTALTDTYTTEFFLQNIRGRLAQTYDALRHDSECPLGFADKVLQFYADEGIDPAEKGIVFSDSLNVDKAVEINRHVAGRTKAWFGIGTHFTNDFGDSRALNIVIKLYEVDGVKVAKISDNPIKASGDPLAVQRSLEAIQAAAVKLA
ncbi:nicotinate phosphoribosyltransferase [Coraliomargarita algicola]|uniref:Nicotinate phosphoribosyltransferase n=1 Tax=Coraliomargarita algicola TaxID=3092156 RepID=A0ABZ0RM37_9BACT|nr:nicotinate phosphoribosyltransferase [Coraliomargarita sp. J2-16]WPJ93994.1 nicotinate phosphoribosyltransferase [Coraliomargarita sp. J2-16]